MLFCCPQVAEFSAEIIQGVSREKCQMIAGYSFSNMSSCCFSLFFFLNNCKFCIFEFWTDIHTKQAIQSCYLGLWKIVMGIFWLNDTLIDSNYNQQMNQ